jgi:hypothetical protein
MPEESQTVTNPAPQPIDVSQIAELFNNVLMPKIESLIDSKMKPSETVQQPTKAQEYLNKFNVEQPDPQPKVEDQSTKSTTTIDTSDFTELKTVSSPEPVDKAVFDEYTRAQQRIAEQEIKLKTLQEEVEKVKKKEYNEVKNELKNLGVTDPDKLVENIKDYEQKIKTLQAFKSTVAKTTPMNSAPQISNEGGSSKAPFTVVDVIKAEHGDPSKYTTEQLERFSRKWGVPIQ